MPTNCPAAGCEEERMHTVSVETLLDLLLPIEACL